MMPPTTFFFFFSQKVKEQQRAGLIVAWQKCLESPQPAPASLNGSGIYKELQFRKISVPLINNNSVVS